MKSSRFSQLIFGLSKRPFFVGLIVCLLPMIPLLNWDMGYDKDWGNHLWTINYYAEYFKSHHNFPTFLNANFPIGNPLPLFYGNYFYPFIAIPAILLGAKVALSAFFLITNLLQYFAVRELFLKFKISDPIAAAVSAMMIWSTYQITNFFNRAAIPEFFAVSWFLSIICITSLLLLPNDYKRSKFFFYSSLIWFTYSLILGTHTITAWVGTICSIALLCSIGGDFVINRKKIFLLLLPAPLALFLTSPWLYTYLKFGKDLYIKATFSKMFFYTDRIDNWPARLIPFPFESAFSREMNSLSTPFLEANIQMPILFLFLMGLLVVSSLKQVEKKRIFILLFLVSLGTLTLFFSVKESWWNSLPSFFKTIQFGYRLVNYVNWILLFLVLVLLSATTLRLQRKLKTTLFFLLGMTFCGLLVKMVHSVAVQRHLDTYAYQLNTEDYLSIPKDFYGWPSYSSQKHLSPRDVIEAPNVPLELKPLASPFGEIAATQITLAEQSMLNSNVLAFPWTHVYVNSVYIPFDKQSATVYGLIKFPLKQGNFKIEVRHEIDPEFLTLRNICYLAFMTWFLSLIFSFFPILRECRPK